MCDEYANHLSQCATISKCFFFFHTGLVIFSVSKNQAHRLCTLIVTFVSFEGANIYFSITLLKALPSHEDFWWFLIGIVFLGVHILCAVQNSLFHLVLIRHTFNEVNCIVWTVLIHRMLRIQFTEKIFVFHLHRRNRAYQISNSKLKLNWF